MHGGRWWSGEQQQRQQQQERTETEIETRLDREGPAWAGWTSNAFAVRVRASAVSLLASRLPQSPPTRPLHHDAHARPKRRVFHTPFISFWPSTQSRPPTDSCSARV